MFKTKCSVLIVLILSLMQTVQASSLEDDHAEVTKLAQHIVNSISSNNLKSFQKLTVTKDELIKDYYLKFKPSSYQKNIKNIDKVISSWNEARNELFKKAVKKHIKKFKRSSVAIQKVKFKQYDKKGLAVFKLRYGNSDNKLPISSINIIKTKNGWKLARPGSKI